MTNTSKLIVPAYRSSWYRDEKTNKEIEQFETAVKELLTKEMPGWEQYIVLSHSDDFYSFKRLNDKFGKAIASFKRGKEFVLTPDKKQKVLDYISSEKASVEAINKHKSIADYMKEIAEPLMDKYRTDDVGIDFNTRSLQIVIACERNSWSNFAEARINKNKTIHTQCERTTLSSIKSAEEYIATYKPYNDKVQEIAEAILKELPEEYFNQ